MRKIYTGKTKDVFTLEDEYPAEVQDTVTGSDGNIDSEAMKLSVKWRARAVHPSA